MEKIEELIEKYSARKERAEKEDESHLYSKGYSRGSIRACIKIIGDLEMLKSSLPTQRDKVVVPEFVGEYIERCKRADSGLIWSIRPDRDANDNSAKVYDWLFPNGAVLPNGEYPKPFEPDNLVRPDKVNQIVFARAWLDGYTVEKEPLYYVPLPEKNTDSYNVYGLKKYSDGKINVSCFDRADIGKSVNSKLTEAEIKSVDERYWAFAVPVEEDE